MVAQTALSREGQIGCLAARIACAYDESRTLVIDQASISEDFDLIRNQHVKPVSLRRCVVLSWFIQNQTQIWAASAESLDYETQVFAGMLLQYLRKLVSGGIGYLHGI